MRNKKKRVDLDVYPEVFFSNYDYGGPEKATKDSPGRGLFNGLMSRHKSITEFLKKKRKRKSELRKKAFLLILTNNSRTDK